MEKIVFRNLNKGILKDIKILIINVLNIVYFLKYS